MSDTLLKGLRPGDRVHLNCGGSAVVEEVAYYGDNPLVVAIQFEGYDRHTFRSSGAWLDEGESLLDIVSVEPAPLTAAERLTKIAKILGVFKHNFDDAEMSELRELANQPKPAVDPLSSSMTEELYDAVRAARDAWREKYEKLREIETRTSAAFWKRDTEYNDLVGERDNLAARVARLTAALTREEAYSLVKRTVRSYNDPIGDIGEQFRELMTKRAAAP